MHLMKNSNRSCRVFFLLSVILHILLVPTHASAAGKETLIGIVGQDFIVLGADTSISSSISLTTNSIDKIRVIVDPFPTVERRGITRHPNEQQVIAVASAGDFASSERLIGHLIAHTSSMEYQHLGCDVKCVFNGEGGVDANADHVHQNNIIHSPAGLDAESVAYLARGLIASSLRSRGQLNTCLLIAGMVRCFNEKVDHDGGKNVSVMSKSRIGTKSFSQKLRDQIQAGTDTYTDSKYPSNEKTTKSYHGVDDGKEILKHSDLSQINQPVLEPRLFWLDEYGSLQKVEYAAHGLASNFVLSILDRQYKLGLSKEEAIDLIIDCFRQLRKRFVINSPRLPCIKCIDANGCELINVERKKVLNQ